VNCDNCQFAVWKHTLSGALHPNNSGRCAYPIPKVVLPAAFYWIGTPTPCGGYIERGQMLSRACEFRVPAPTKKPKPKAKKGTR